MDLTTTKIVVALLFGMLRFFFGMLPLKLYKLLRRWEEEDDSNTFINKKRHTQVNCAIALCQSFGGGVLFATCFLHMMVQVYRSMLEVLGNVNTDYPVSQLIICVGFFFVYFSEELSHWFITRLPDEPCSANLKKSKSKTSVTPLEEPNGIRNTFRIDKKEQIKDKDEKAIKELKADMLSLDGNHESIVYDSLSLNSEGTKENEKNLQLNKENAEDVVEYEFKTKQQIMRWVFMVVSLSMHAIFEGLAIGLQKSKSDIWYLFIAVSIHSATILFCMGLELLLAKTKTIYIFMQISVLAISSPFGVCLGLLFTIKSDLKTTAMAIVLLEGFSAGAILYIIFFEVLNREKERRVLRMYRALCILGGFSLMAFLQYLEVYHQ